VRLASALRTFSITNSSVSDVKTRNKRVNMKKTIKKIPRKSNGRGFWSEETDCAMGRVSDL
jgi:hypothetical protein